MSVIREFFKYKNNPGLILPCIKRKLFYPLNYTIAELFVKFAGREKLRKGRHIALFGAFGGRRYGDNSAVFFEYMLSVHPEIESYWVCHAEFYRNAAESGLKRFAVPFERILVKDSFRANVMALIADIYVYSHGRYDITDYPKDINSGVFDVLLGHGIDGLKRIHMEQEHSGAFIADYAKEADVIVASSIKEAEIKNKEWGISASKIVVSGLPRHDRLLSWKKTNATPSGNVNILYMPTWRRWNVRKNSLKDSDFFHEVGTFIKDPRLHDCLKSNNICMQLYVHMWMREFFDEFKNELLSVNIKVLDQETNLQDIILKSSLLITDYSSVCWDYLLLDKPVLFYQFDLDEYLANTGSYINMKKDLSGPVAYDAEEAVSAVCRFVENGFSAEPLRAKMERMKKFAFAYTDGKNCERLAEAIIARTGLYKE